jgi:dTDP-4-amino-4,6-dideoxygalactose transaminase
VGSGTFAVELALRALKVGAGDEVILAGYDFPGNFLAIHAVGAMPVLVDLDPATGNLDPSLLRPAITPRTRAILVAHLHGGQVPMRPVMDLAGETGLQVIEDVAQCPGAMVQGRRAGAWGDVAIVSFGGSKLLTAGRGGALLTPHRDVLQRARTYLHRGNLICPLSDLQAAVLLPQLEKLDQGNAARLAAVRRLLAGLGDLPGLRAFAAGLLDEGDSSPAFYKVGFHYDAAAWGLPRKTLVAAARAEGVPLDAGFPALHVGRSPSRYRQAGPLPQAERAHESVVVLHHPVLLAGDRVIDQVAAALRKIHRHRAELAG